MTNLDKRTRAVAAAQVLLTLTGFEFFGPIGRDFNASHAMNPTWVGHARLHLVWLLGFMLFSGLANVYLVWFRRPFEVRNLWLSAAWQCCNLGGFWVAVLLAPAYGGLVRVPDEHIQLLGVNENVLVFAVLSTLMAAALLLLRAAGATGGDRATR
jgi:hypothetical protein